MPAVCRGDSVDCDVVHCSVPRRDDRSHNVFVNGTRVSCQGDNNTVHLLPPAPCPSHAAPITTGSTTVFVHGDGIGRIDDAVTACTRVATGSSNVFAGP